MLKKIKMSNYECGKVLLRNDDTQTLAFHSDTDSDCSSDEDGKPQVILHPMDSLLALIHCSDDFLRQDLYAKLNTAQLAVPLLLPNPHGKSSLIFPLWCLRSIIRKWKFHFDSETTKYCEDHVITTEAPLVSFVRFSHPKYHSKSAILNKVIGNAKHHNFFNYECEGSSVKRDLADGVVESSWYLPSGEASDIFNNMITFANLRGNAGVFVQQFNILSSLSCLMFIFVSEDDLTQYQESIKRLAMKQDTKVVFLIQDKAIKEKLKTIVPRCVTIHLSSKEPASNVRKIQERINKELQQTNLNSCQLSKALDSKFFKDINIVVDENINASCQKGKKHAEELMASFQDTPSKQVKEKMVPLQGPKMWQKWGEIDKKQNRTKSDEMGNVTLTNFVENREKEKNEIRRQQAHKASIAHRSEVMKLFIKALMTLSTVECEYFLKWLKFYLDEHSRDVLPDIQKTCNDLREKIRSKSKSKDQAETNTLREKLKVEDKKLILASFGVEHLFREMGQMYECATTGSSALGKEVKKFPKLAANLLLSGYPLEIIDGDAAHVPQKWVSAILEALQAKVQNSEISVLSVLGIQSTGKSTLMNTLFGIRFAVSAGRCTRGAYMQLIQVNSQQYTSKYMLIIDTEGLRAPELDCQQHDNELAALVIGLAGVTIINIFGEVAGDINDILQTTVHAFLRMSKVQLKPSCQFVRHHVANVGADKSHDGSQKFLETLDSMTVLAAKAEHCEGKYDFFTQVINFDNKTDVQNFPSLWEGNPPMAPVNPAYCEAAEKLRSKLIGLNRQQNFLCTISEFNTRLSKLWEAVLKENFIFSFKNTLEVEAFSKLEQAYGKWQWRLSKVFLDWETETKRILTTATQNVSNIKTKQLEEIMNRLQKEYEEITKDMYTFFNNSSSTLAPILNQWKTRYENKIAMLKSDYQIQASGLCDNLIQENKARQKLDEMKRSERMRINEQFKALVASSVIRKEEDLTEKELKDIESKFDKQWKQWMDQVKANYPIPEKIALNKIIIKSVRLWLTKHDKLVTEALAKHKNSLQKYGNPLDLMVDENNHINFSRYSWQKLGFMSKETHEDILKNAKKLTNKYLESVKAYIAKLRKSDTASLSYETHIDAVIQETLVSIDEQSQDPQNVVSFTAKYRVDLMLTIGGYMLIEFEKIQDETGKNHPVAYLSSLKSSFSQSFKALCTAAAKEKVAAMFLADNIAKKLLVAMQENIVTRLADDLIQNRDGETKMFESKTNLKGTVLLRLLEADDFDLYEVYLTNISDSYLHWIKQYINEYTSTKLKNGKLVKITNVANDELKKLITSVTDAAAKATEAAVMNPDKSISNWLEFFQKAVGSGKIELNKDELKDSLSSIPEPHQQQTANGDPDDLQKDDYKQIHERSLHFFSEEFVKEIKAYETRYFRSFMVPNQSRELAMEAIISRAAVIVRDSKAGCCEQCPWCKEQCERTDKDHTGIDHTCTLHRPQCLGGYRLLDSRKMLLDICTNDVGSDRSFSCKKTNFKPVPCKNYRDYYEDWDIPDDTRKPAPYWKWFTGRYKDDIKQLYKFEKAHVDSEWTKMKKADAEKDVKERFNLS